jgi:hypothetical protein
MRRVLLIDQPRADQIAAGIEDLLGEHRIGIGTGVGWVAAVVGDDTGVEIRGSGACAPDRLVGGIDDRGGVIGDAGGVNVERAASTAPVIGTSASESVAATVNAADADANTIVSSSESVTQPQRT